MDPERTSQTRSLTPAVRISGKRTDTDHGVTADQEPAVRWTYPRAEGNRADEETSELCV
jgi:hypothetical protein